MLHFRTPNADPDLSDLFEEAVGQRAQPKPQAKSEFAASGISHAALIETDRGAVLVRDLRRGDLLLTRDHGLQPVRWIGASATTYQKGPVGPGSARFDGPVRIKAGACGTNPEGGNLLLSPGQRLLVCNPLNEALFATREVLAAAGDLTHLDGIDTAPRRAGRWAQVLFDTHEIIRVNGLWVESFLPDMRRIRSAFPREWAEITEVVPRLRYENAAANYVHARLVLDPREARLLDAI